MKMHVQKSAIKSSLSIKIQSPAYARLCTHDQRYDVCVQKGERVGVGEELRRKKMLPLALALVVLSSFHPMQIYSSIYLILLLVTLQVNLAGVKSSMFPERSIARTWNVCAFDDRAA